MKRALEGAGIDFDLEVPSTRSAMTESIREAAASGRSRLAVVGGDGTVSLAANEILKTEWTRRPVLGVLPGWDWWRPDFEHSACAHDLEEAARHLLGDSVYPIDVGRLEGEWGVRYFRQRRPGGRRCGRRSHGRRHVASVGEGSLSTGVRPSPPRVPRGPSSLLEMDVQGA